MHDLRCPFEGSFFEMLMKVSGDFSDNGIIVPGNEVRRAITRGRSLQQRGFGAIERLLERCERIEDAFILRGLENIVADSELQGLLGVFEITVSA
ncbi:hypothetical protein D3C72_1607740 [compost metagenome]